MRHQIVAYRLRTRPGEREISCVHMASGSKVREMN
jgi:hypothetical protein